ncbi:MAG: hypothetical protein ACM3S1_03710, partial [Hyphomicrobiales bacterium]
RSIFGPPTKAGRVFGFLIGDFIHFVMERKMMLTIKRLAEASSRERQAVEGDRSYSEATAVTATAAGDDAAG